MDLPEEFTSGAEGALSHGHDAGVLAGYTKADLTSIGSNIGLVVEGTFAPASMQAL